MVVMFKKKDGEGILGTRKEVKEKKGDDGWKSLC